MDTEGDVWENRGGLMGDVEGIFDEIGGVYF